MHTYIHSYIHTDIRTYIRTYRGIKVNGVVRKFIIFTSMVNRTINCSRNERLTLPVYDTCLHMFDECTLRHTAHIEAIVQFLPYSDQQASCDGLHSSGNSVLQIRYAYGLWWHKHFVLHVTPKEVVTIVKRKTVSFVPRFLLTHAAVLHFFLYKGILLSETADTSL